MIMIIENYMDNDKNKGSSDNIIRIAISKLGVKVIYTQECRRYPSRSYIYFFFFFPFLKLSINPVFHG